MTEVHVVLPGDIDDPACPSGGNTYDRRVCRGLCSLSWSVHEHAVPGSWPEPDAQALAALAGVLGRIPDRALVLLDGLVASTAPDPLVFHARRLRQVVLVHMLLGHRPAGGRTGEIRRREGRALWAGAAVVATSQWSRNRLLELYGLPADRVHVARPGVDPSELTTVAATGGRLLCVAAVTVEKGHDLLITALRSVSELSWECQCVGSVARDPVFVESLRRQARKGGLGDRVAMRGVRSGADLDRSYAAADLMVLASRADTYGLVVTEALARGVPVVVADVGGLPEAMGYGARGIRPGLVVAPDDPVALGAALRAWLGDAGLRRRLRSAARERRTSLSAWSDTTSAVARALRAATR